MKPSHHQEAEPTYVPGDYFGSCRIIRPLGKGGASEVYLVESPMSTDYHAIKILVSSDEDQAIRFIKEAERLMGSRHPNLVKVYDAGQDPETGRYFIDMEYLAGGSLRSLFEKYPNGLPLSIVGSIFRDCVRGLVAIAAKGLVHRDIKPENILLTREGRAKLADLGVSFALLDVARPTLTVIGKTVGTPAYMAPEQMLSSSGVTGRTDIYSLGVVFYEMLTGRRPNADKPALTNFAQALEGQSFPDVRLYRPEVPEAWSHLLAEMTAPRPEDRPPHASVILERLRTRQGVATSARNAGHGPAKAAMPYAWYHDSRTLYACVAVIFAFEMILIALVHAWIRR